MRRQSLLILNSLIWTESINYIIGQFGATKVPIIFWTNFEIKCKFQYWKTQISKKKVHRIGQRT